MLPSEILRKAQQQIVKYGWVKGRMGSPDEGFCMYGALGSVCNLANMMIPYNYLLKIIYSTPSEYNKMKGIGIFNDDPMTTKTEVIEVFNRAIALAKLKERA